MKLVVASMVFGLLGAAIGAGVGAAVLRSQAKSDASELRDEITAMRSELAALRAQLATPPAPPPVPTPPPLPPRDVAGPLPCDPSSSRRGCPPPDPPATSQVQIKLVTDPAGADVVDVTTGRLLGRTPVAMMVAGSTTPRAFTLRRTGYRDLRVEVIPERDLAYTAVLQKVPRGTRSSTDDLLLDNPFDSRN